LSPQAARVALCHLDAWLVSPEGQAEMACAETASHAAGEPILHVGDRIRLEGLVKNTAVNGMVGTLIAYGADSIRWKVLFADGQSFWAKPKLLKPLEPRRKPLPSCGEVAGAATSGGVQSQAPPTSSGAAAAALAAGWAQLEARQVAWKDEQEAREIELLEREEALRKLQEALEAQQHVLGEQAEHIHERERRASEAGSMAATTTTPAQLPGEAPARMEMSAGIHESPEFLPADTLETSLHGVREIASHSLDEEGECEEDEVWDMDWATLSRTAAASSASAPYVPPEAKCSDVALNLPPMAAPPSEASAEREAVTSEAEASARGGRVSPRTDWSSSNTSPGSEISHSAASSVATSAGVSQKASGAVRCGSPRSPRSPRAVAFPRDAPGMPTPERQALQQKLEEKRKLAELHNGEDLTTAPTREYDKGRMPGVHPDVARKLEERRRKIDVEEEQLAGAQPPVAA